VCSAIPEINAEDVTLISDRDKGLAAADSVLNLTRRAYCCQHIADNIQTKFGLAARKQFWKIAYARSELLYDNALDELRVLKPAAADYIAALPRNLYAVAFFTGARFEHYTSNIVEAANALFLEERELPVLDMLHGILEKEMDRRSSRQERALNCL
jgi:zinc finger SWIM domain-containing protein 3